MRSRLELQELLESVDSSLNVYYQPPESLKISYPALIYTKNDIVARHADNNAYMLDKTYSLTLIYKDPDSDLCDKILSLSGCRFDRHYVSDNLNHDSFVIHF